MQFPSPPPGILRVAPFRSRHLGEPRLVDICLPPEAREMGWARFPVVYMLDGQNVFDPGTSFIRGKTWRADQTANRCFAARTVRPCIQVAIWNAGAGRMNEYTHDTDPKYGGGGAARHDSFLIEELKPWIDKNFPTRPGFSDTALVGSSLGGLYALEIAQRHPSIFGNIGAPSPSLWWNNRALLRSLSDRPLPTNIRIWMDIGDKEGESAVRDVNDCLAVLEKQPGRAPGTLRSMVERGAGHDENAWAGRYGSVLEHLMPARKTHHA